VKNLVKFTISGCPVDYHYRNWQRKPVLGIALMGLIGLCLDCVPLNPVGGLVDYYGSPSWLLQAKLSINWCFCQSNLLWLPCLVAGKVSYREVPYQERQLMVWEWKYDGLVGRLFREH